MDFNIPGGRGPIQFNEKASLLSPFGYLTYDTTTVEGVLAILLQKKKPMEKKKKKKT